MKHYLWIFLILLSVLGGITSCKEEPVVYSEWNNITLINEYGYDLPDVLNAELQILTSDGGNYNIECVFSRSADSTFILSQPIKIPTQSNAVYFYAKINSNGWNFYASTNLYGSYSYMPENDVRINLSKGNTLLSYFIVDSLSLAFLSYRFKIDDPGIDTVLDYLVRIKISDDEVIYDTVFQPTLVEHSGIVRDLPQDEKCTMSLYAHHVGGYSLIRLVYWETDAIPLPISIVTNAVSNVTRNSAIFSGEVTYTFDTINIIESGFVYNTSSQPVCPDDQYYVCGSGTGSIVKDVYSLVAGTEYFVRAYVRSDNSQYYYGNEVSFTTIAGTVAEVANVTIHSVTNTTALCSSYIIDNGGLDIADKGFVVGLSNNPTFQNSFIVSSCGSGDESFYKNISGLSPDTRYYVRAYAITSAGIYWGDVDAFRTDFGK